MTWPGKILLASAIPLIRWSSCHEVPYLDAIPESVSPGRTVYVALDGAGAGLGAEAGLTEGLDGLEVPLDWA